MKSTLYRIHVSFDSSVWFAVDEHMPVPVGMTVDTFIQNNPFKQDDQAVLLGARSNAHMLLELYKLKQNKTLKSLKICSPDVCKSTKRRNDPKIVLLDLMQTKELAGSLGGWHEFHETDYHSFNLALQSDENQAIKCLKEHPVFKPLAFIQTLDLLSTAQLIGGLIDPRWYVDTDEPDADTKIHGYLGLNPRTQHAVNSNDNEMKVYALERCKLVLDAWKKTEPTEQQLTHPGNFLWRAFKESNQDTNSEMRVSQQFVTYLKYNWLDVIYKQRGGASKEGLFAPEYFFKNKDEVDAYKAYMKG